MELTPLSEKEVTDRLISNFEKIMFIHKLSPVDIASMIHPRDSPEWVSIGNIIRKMVNRSNPSMPSYYTLYKIWFALPFIELKILYSKESNFSKKYETTDTSSIVEEQSVPYNVKQTDTWLHEKIALLEQINNLNEQLRECMKRTLL
jgi:hypothetical protein